MKFPPPEAPAAASSLISADASPISFAVQSNPAARIIFGPAPEVGPEAETEDTTLEASASMAPRPSGPDTPAD